MSKHFKIHPGIGVARVGASGDGYFIAAETFGGKPFELSDAGETEFRGYKDASFLMRPEGVRFRVFEYDRDDATGALAFVGEVTPEKAAVRWSVKLGNRKAAGPRMVSRSGPQGERVIVPGSTRRNDEVDDQNRNRLVAEASASGIEGENVALRSLNGTVMERPVLLGRVGADHRGRLVVVGGEGKSDSWKTPPAPLPDYLNNDGWYDDIADGPVDAELVFADGTRRNVDGGAWVIVGPPDFAPDIVPFVSLYDLMFDALVRAGRVPRPTRVSFQHDVWPILNHAARLRWVNLGGGLWDSLTELIRDPAALADAGSGAQGDRVTVRDALLGCEGTLSDFRLTRTQKEVILARWAAGQFESDLGSPAPRLNQAEELDQVVLRRCIGSGLFPGIEMGFLATNATIYSELCRFTRGQYQEGGQSKRLEPGSVTQRMALPWQADFMECETAWWPFQRPDMALFRADGTPTPPGFRWDRGLVVVRPDTHDSHLNMVRHFAKLGVVLPINVGGEEVLAETGRSPDLPA